MKRHPDHGVNPHYAFCYLCGGPTEEFYLLGIYNEVYTCPSCHKRHLGRPAAAKCQHCELPFDCGTWSVHNLRSSETIPSQKACGFCEGKTDEEREAVQRGGVYYLCKGCGKKGVLYPDDPMAGNIREFEKIPAPTPLMYELTHCKQCSHTKKQGEATQ